MWHNYCTSTERLLIRVRFPIWLEIFSSFYKRTVFLCTCSHLLGHLVKMVGRLARMLKEIGRCPTIIYSPAVDPQLSEFLALANSSTTCKDFFL